MEVLGGDARLLANGGHGLLVRRLIVAVLAGLFEACATEKRGGLLEPGTLTREFFLDGCFLCKQEITKLVDNADFVLHVVSPGY